MTKVNKAQIAQVTDFLISPFGKRNDKMVYDVYRDYARFNMLITVSEDVFFTCLDKIPHAAVVRTQSKGAF